MSLEQQGGGRAGRWDLQLRSRHLREGLGSPGQATQRLLFSQKAPLRLPKAA